MTAVANAVFKTFLASEAGKPGPVAMDNSGFCYELYHFFFLNFGTVLKLSRLDLSCPDCLWLSM